MISSEKWMILAPLQKLPKNVESLGKLIVAKGFKKLPKVQKIANSGHTAYEWHLKRSPLIIHPNLWRQHASVVINFSLADIHYAEIKHPEWMLKVMWQVLTIWSDLFQHCVVMFW